MQELQHLNSKLDQLLKKYAALEVENIHLRSTYAEQLKTIEALNEKLNIAEQNIKAAHIKKDALGTADKEKMRKQIDIVIGEIDKILNSPDVQA